MKVEDTKSKKDGKQAAKTAGPPKAQTIKIKEFFRYLTFAERVYLWVGTISSLLCGIITPGIAIASGYIINAFNPHNSVDDILGIMKILAGAITLVGVGSWIFGYLYYAFWQHLAQNITYDLRSRYLKAILRQEISYFEKQNVEQIPQQIGNSFFTINDALGEKFANIIFSLSCFLSGLGISIYSGVDLAFVCIAFFPIIFVILCIFMS